MDFSWPEEYLEYKQKVQDFAINNLNDDVIERDHKGEFSNEFWKSCADFGILGLAAPKSYGGQQEEVNLLRAVLAMEALGYGCKDLGLVLGLNAHMWTVQMSIVLFGSEEQKQSYLPPLLNGSMIGCHALTEPGSGSDVFNMKTTADLQGDHYVLNGEKRLVTLAPVSDLALVFALTDSSKGKWGISAFLVETDTEGCTKGESQQKMGLRTAPIGRIKFENCRLPVANRLGREGAGFSISNHSLEYDRCCIMAGQIGLMQRQIDNAVSYATEREQFGKKIANFQSVTNRIADMKLRMETSKLLLYKLAYLKTKGESAMLESAMLKLHLSESAVSNSLDAIRTHGGNGYLTEHGIERGLRDTIGGLLYAGTSDIQRNIISRFLGL